MASKTEKIRIAELFKQEQHFRDVLKKILDIVSPELSKETLQELDSIIKKNTRSYLFTEANYTDIVLGNKIKAQQLIDELFK